MKRELTMPRLLLLQDIAERPGSYADHYPPLKWLWANRYVEEYGRGGLFRVTPAGRALLAEARDG